MNELITVQSFTYPLEMAIPRSLLESEGIECFVKDELMAQIHPAVNHSTGIQLQVKASQFEQAVEILKERGYLKEEDLEPTGIYKAIGKFLSKFEKKRK